MKNLFTIIKKELRRFFTDKRMLMALLLPGLLVFILYSIMGDVMTNVTENKGHTYTLLIENEPAGYHFLVGDEYEYLTYDAAADYETMIKDEKLDIHVVFDADWAQKLNDDLQPTVTFYYNEASIPSMTLLSYYNEFLTMATQPFTLEINNLAESGDVTLMIMTSLLPFLLITFLFSGSMAVAPESIAGEKERGTIASLLITPVKRSTIALGKIIALSLVAMVSATSSFLGIILSLPKLAGTSVDITLYSAGTYFALLLVLLSTILIFIVLISLISAFAKSIKEASGLATPLMIVIMAVGVTTMFGSAATNPFVYLIPVYNSVNVLLTLFSGKFMLVPFILTIITNLTVTGLGVFALTQMFNSERIMFRK